MFMFTAFQTCGNVAILAIIYGVFSASNLITPSVVAIVGPQISMFVSGLFYSICLHRNCGCRFQQNDRRTVFIALAVISLVGTVLFFLIRKPDPENLGEEESCDDQDMEAIESAQNNVTKAVDAFKKVSEVVRHQGDAPPECYDCLHRSGADLLLWGVRNLYWGRKQVWDRRESLIGLSGIFIGIGEILGGSLFGLLSKNNRFGRNPVVLLGTLVHFVAFYLIFLNMPGDAPIAPVEGTDSSAYIRPSKEVAILCSFLLGLGDSCFNTQLLSILGFLYSEDSAPAFAVFKFVQSICAAVAFFYSNYLLLHWQLLVMVIFGFFGTISFFTVEWDAAAIVARGSDYRSI
ncbi:UNC93-like protein MFSD11 [Apodemus speciosus]|uniref:UNC93-like protein MFSD11 n=1 Tax=Apodemus speciosus TaxID=105296 RepID=A0ABQ0FCX7_APOSI